MKHLEVLRAELERLFDLNELMSLSRDILGFDPEQIGGQATLSSFAGSLLVHCEKQDAIAALADAVRSSGHDVSPAVMHITGTATAEESLLSAGTELGDYRVARLLSESRLAASYLAKGPSGDVRLNVIHPEAARDRRALQRYLVATRLAGSLHTKGFPALIYAGPLADHIVVIHQHIEGQPLSARVARTGPMHINEARPLLAGIAQALSELHALRIAHGALSLESIISYRSDNGPAVALLDVALDRLRTVPDENRTGLASTSGDPRTVAPEQIQGGQSERSSDLYSLGAVMFELLSGNPVFRGSVLEMAYGHLAKEPPAPSSLAPRGWVSSDIDQTVLRLLSKSPKERGSIQSFLSELETLGRAKTAEDVTEEQLNDLEQQLLAEPGNDELAMNLEATIGRGATTERIGQAFRLAASMVEDPAETDAKLSLLARAARLFAQNEASLEKAEAAYEEILSLDPRNGVALAGIEEVRRRSGKFEELLEMLLGRAEAASSPAEQAKAMADIGRVYFLDLEDNEQAVVAFSQAFCDDPCDEYAHEVERSAGTSEHLWAEALATVAEATLDESRSTEVRNQLLVQAGVWYFDKVARADLALSCLQTALASEPSNETALHYITRIYRKSQQWQELGMMLTHRADAAATPEQARDLRTESAEILEHRLGDIASARAIYELVLSEDPAHQKAGEALARLLERQGDYDMLVQLLEQRLGAQPKDAALRTLCRIADIYDERLNRPDEAADRYSRALSQDPTHLDALKGLERIFQKQGKCNELLQNLEKQSQLAATPKQRIGILEHIARVQEEEFLNHEAAAQALQRALQADPGRVSAMAALVRQLRVLERWEEASRLYERQLELTDDSQERITLALAWGRLLAEQIGSPERAVQAYEKVLLEDSEHALALEALAKLREATGDADEALAAIISLAEQAETHGARAEQYLRAAKLQESRGNRDAAIEHYKNALDAQPENRNIAAALRAAYVARGDINAAVDLLERELSITEGELGQAKLAGEMARLQYERLKDPARAEKSAERALHLDPGNLEALVVWGDICFAEQRFVEASAHYRRVADRIEAIGEERAVPVLIKYVDALSKSGSTEGALAAMDVLQRLAPHDREAVGRVARVTFEHGSPARAADLLADYLERFGSQVGERDRAEVTFQLGESYRKSGRLEEAVETLQVAMELDPGSMQPLEALAAVYLEQGNYAEAIRTKTEQLDILDGDARLELLIEVGDLYAAQLQDHTQAARSYVAALEERPDDRRLLTKLMQLYSEDKDWNKLVEVVVKLAEFVDQPAQKVKYLQTAALVSARQIGDPAQAASYFEQVLEFDPGNEKALKELTDIRLRGGEYAEVEELLKRRLAHAEETEDVAAQVAVYDQLGELYETHLVEPELAAAAFEAGNSLEPDNRARLDKLGAIYGADPETFRERGVQLQEHLLRQNPFRQESYKALRKIYTVARDADASWALCQVLSVLKLAEPDEQRFYERMRADTAAPAQDAFIEEDWMRVMHPTLDPLLTAVFALIQPAVVAARALPPEHLGVTGDMWIDPSRHEKPVAQTLYYAAGVLGLPLPHVYANPNDPGGLSYLYATEPSLSLGRMAMSSQVPAQVAAFVAARQLSYLRPGLYLRYFIQTGTAMKAWLFAAIKLTAPQFPIAADLEGGVSDALAALRQFLPGDIKDHLSSVVSKLIQSGTSLDLKRWVAAVDMTADRVGFVVSHDLQTTVEVVGASDESTAAVGNEERFKQLVLFAASSDYFALRRRLGIAVDS